MNENELIVKKLKVLYGDKIKQVAVKNSKYEIVKDDNVEYLLYTSDSIFRACKGQVEKLKVEKDLGIDSVTITNVKCVQIEAGITIMHVFYVDNGGINSVQNISYILEHDIPVSMVSKSWTWSTCNASVYDMNKNEKFKSTVISTDTDYETYAASLYRTENGRLVVMGKFWQTLSEKDSESMKFIDFTNVLESANEAVCNIFIFGSIEYLLLIRCKSNGYKSICLVTSQNGKSDINNMMMKFFSNSNIRLYKANDRVVLQYTIATGHRIVCVIDKYGERKFNSAMLTSQDVKIIFEGAQLIFKEEKAKNE